MRLLALVFCCFALSCSSMRQQLAWSEYAITVNDPKNTPTQSEMDNFFDITVTNDHPYFTREFQLNIDKNTHSRLTSGNKLELLLNGASQKMKLKLINEARASIFVATFQLACDETGVDFIDALAKAVKRNVDVRVLQSDSLEQWMFSKDCGTRLQRGGINFEKIVHPSIGKSARIHDKILVVDGVNAIIGGQNIADWHANSNGKDGNFRDTDVLLDGPAVIDVARRFTLLWQGARPKDTSLKNYLAQLNENEKRFTREGLIGPSNYRRWLKTGGRKGLCRFVSQDPHLSTYNVAEAYRLHIEQAQKRIVFQTLFLQPSSLWKPIYELNNKPDLRVWMMTNGPGYLKASVMGPFVGRALAYYFLGETYWFDWPKSMEVFAYGSWLHSKAYYFDGVAVAIGSFNYDNSYSVFTENTLICMDPIFISEVTQMLKEDLSNSYKWTKISQDNTY